MGNSFQLRRLKDEFQQTPIEGRGENSLDEYDWR